MFGVRSGRKLGNGKAAVAGYCPLMNLTSVALLILGGLTAACSSETLDGRQDSAARVNAVPASDAELRKVLKLSSSEQIPNGRGVPIAYAAPWSEGLVWSAPGLACDVSAFSGFIKVDLVGDSSVRRDMAEALAEHNRRRLASRAIAARCERSD